MKHSDSSGNLEQLRLQLERRLKELRYSPDTINNYWRVFDWLAEFMGEGDLADYSPPVGKRFLEQYSCGPHRPHVYFRNARVLVARLDELLAGGQHVVKHYNPTAYRGSYFPLAQQSYAEMLKGRGNKPTTIKDRLRYVGRFLEKLSGRGLASLEGLKAGLLTDVLTKDDCPSEYLSVVKSFLAFLYDEGGIKEDISRLVPRKKKSRPLPSVYTGEEIDRMLKAVDRATASGKRDYAVLMLAVRLGLRSSDITNLALSNIDFEHRSIHIIQVKTGAPLTLPFDHEVSAALSDYITNGRPDTGSDKVILAAVAPHYPVSSTATYQLVDRYLAIAGIEKAGRKSGPHALRMSFATSLINGGAPYTVVAKALGHDGFSSIGSYVRLDVSMLRRCAIDVPHPTGAFAELLHDTKEV
ncbi:MAG: tyrosine-type recombinase/integrase [Coriobacteriales bacterium]|jgi:site-specific recombinase XerD|nr:tyrosine-type recombinase/integrase [Coriobacteriales bacterium]